jgi:subtilisin family serine protease
VRVLDCGGSGTWEGVIAGIDWVTNDHISGPAVANMSLGGGFNSAVNAAITASIADGVTYAVAAGNSSANACNYSPASTPNALTVGATTSTDARASYSNYGTCVDILAPGTNITSDWIGSGTATNTISGTSMATPHVTGAAALYLTSNPSASSAAVASALKAAATAGVITGAGTGTPNLLLYMGPPPTFGTIRGTVKALAGGAAISGATVSTNSGQSTTTASDGTYSISNVPTGTRSVTASAPGYVTSTPANVTVLENMTSTQNFTLAVNPVATSVGATLTCAWGSGSSSARRQLRVTATVRNDLNATVSGAVVSISITRAGQSPVVRTGTTGSNGAVVLTYNTPSSGTYASTLTGVTATLPWNGAVPTPVSCSR